MGDLKQPGQRAYEAWTLEVFGEDWELWELAHDYWDELADACKDGWRVVEQACAVHAEPEQDAARVRRAQRLVAAISVGTRCRQCGDAYADPELTGCMGCVQVRRDLWQPLPAEPEQAGKAQGWIPVEERSRQAPGEGRRVMARREFTTRCAICGVKLDGDPYTRALLPGKKRRQRAHLRCLDRLQQLAEPAKESE